MTQTRQTAVVRIAGVVALGWLASVVHAQQNADAPVVPVFSPVTAERLVNAQAEPHNWLMYSGGAGPTSRSTAAVDPSRAFP